jgi:chemotaxis protein histidine kinase CheA
MVQKHAVVDGSNIATEGRSEPSLAQLNEAVASFDQDHAFSLITVIVDASFEHRIAKSERDAARDAIDNNTIITPPAGVIGRGDTFILEVANRVDAVVLSNDSFQEFHGTYDWLFDEGRLIGGKPVPGIGWIFVPRLPVRGPVSRKATRSSQKVDKVVEEAVEDVVEDVDVDPKPEPPKAARRGRKAAAEKKPEAKAARPAKKPAKKSGGGRRDDGNGAKTWNAFRRANPVGSSVRATVEKFSSHGAYARADGIEIYLPLRLMADPAPRRPRDAVSIGQTQNFTIDRYDVDRHGVDAGIIIPATLSGETATAKKAAKKAPAKKAAPKKAAKKAPAKKAAPKKAAKKAPAKKAAPKKAAKKAPAKKAAPKKAARRRR